MIASGAYSLEAVPGGGAGSVRFKIGSTTKVENTAPYALFGDKNGGKDFNGAPLPSGPQTVTVEAFSGRNASGTKIAAESLDFTFRFVPSAIFYPFSAIEVHVPFWLRLRHQLEGCSPFLIGFGVLSDAKNLPHGPALNSFSGRGAVLGHL